MVKAKASPKKSNNGKGRQESSFGSQTPLYFVFKEVVLYSLVMFAAGGLTIGLIAGVFLCIGFLW